MLGSTHPPVVAEGRLSVAAGPARFSNACAHEAAGRWVLGERQFMADSSLIESVNWPVLSIRFLQKAQIKSNAVCWGQIWLIADIAIGQQP